MSSGENGNELNSVVKTGLLRSIADLRFNAP